MKEKEIILDMNFRTTAEIPIPEKKIDWVIGQEKAVEIVKKAAKQMRNILMIGPPGCGKSLLAQAMAEILPKRELEDVLIYPNPEDPNNPKVKHVKAGDGKKIIEEEKKKVFLITPQQNQGLDFTSFLFVFLITSFIAIFPFLIGWSDVLKAACILISAFFFVFFLITLSLAKNAQGMLFHGNPYQNIPKLLIDNSGKDKAPFIEATGSKAGALLGDVKHDPFQDPRLGVPPHLRVVPGAIHKANKGVLFIDEISTTPWHVQQQLLTALQEKKFSITGQSEMSSGAMVRTEPINCDFVLVASGNLPDLKNIHPALRSRIRGYGYEVYLEDSMLDTMENKRKLARFVAQEVIKDGKIPHFNKEAVEEIILEAKRRAGRKGRLTLILRDLSGLVRAAGDVALSKGKNIVEREDVLEAKKSAKNLEDQIADQAIELKKEYGMVITEGSIIGRINGLAVIGHTGGVVLPIEAEIVPAPGREGRIIATGKLGEIAKEAVTNVSAIIKKYKGKDLSEYDIHVQYLQTYEGVEGDSASITMATAIISSLEKIPIRQDIAMTGSLSIKGEVLPVGGVTYKIEAAYHAGIKEVIIPYANKDDVVLPKEILENMKIHYVKTLNEVLDIALDGKLKKRRLVKKIKEVISA
jgi:Lon-like ATP-dependent protease